MGVIIISESVFCVWQVFKLISLKRPPVNLLSKVTNHFATEFFNGNVITVEFYDF